MKVLIDICHPGHVHFYKYTIWELQKKGHEVLVSARNKDVTIPLLDHYGFHYVILSTIKSSILGMAEEFIKRELALIRLIRTYKPDIVSEIGGVFIAPVCKLLRKPAIVFTDSEPVPIDKFLVYPIATKICTPNCFLNDIGKNHIRYAGYHELAYLSPTYYKPDKSVLNKLHLKSDEPYIVLRFVSWKANHDIGQNGFTIAFKRKIIKKLGVFGKIFITSETKLETEFERYRINLPPHMIHDVLYYAKLFLGDGATMATEAGILGTPSIRSSSMALNMGNFLELMNRYQLVESFYSPEKALQKAITLLKQDESKEKWKKRSDIMLREKIDVPKFMLDLFESYNN